MKKIFILVFIFLSLILCDLSFAVMANPNIKQMKQPDGTSVDIKLYGDEFYSWLTFQKCCRKSKSFGFGYKKIIEK